MTTITDINACSFDQWFPLFDSMPRRTTLRSTVIPLDNSFIDYLKQDGVMLPASITKPLDDTEEDEDVFSDNSDTEHLDKEFERFKLEHAHNIAEEDDLASDEQSTNCPEFPEVIEAIRESLEEYEGAVFPKMNWSCPRDSQWILTDSKFLKCTTVEDVFLVLKSSQFIVHDIDNAYTNVHAPVSDNDKVKPILVLRKWYDLDISMEFRCFVKNKRLVAISQRHHQYFEFLKKERYSTLEPMLIQFWNDTVRDRFPLDNYTVDLYIQRNKQDLKKSRVYVVDFNIYGPPTDPLLLESWDNELLTPDGPVYEQVIFRLVESELGTIKPTTRSYGGLPSDFYDQSVQSGTTSFEEVD